MTKQRTTAPARRKVRSIRHIRFEVTTPSGETAQVYGDPHMDSATLDALVRMIDLAQQQLVEQQQKDGQP